MVVWDLVLAMVVWDLVLDLDLAMVWEDLDLDLAMVWEDPLEDLSGCSPADLLHRPVALFLQADILLRLLRRLLVRLGPQPWRPSLRHQR